MGGYMATAHRSDWGTPRDLFDVLNAEFHFTLDAAATAENAKCPEFITPEMDALSPLVPWTGRVFINPPYGVGLLRWIKKAIRERDLAEVIVMLLPARTDTRWFHQLLAIGAEIRFLRGRLMFEGAPACSTFPSIIVVIWPTKAQAAKDSIISDASRLDAQVEEIEVIERELEGV